MFVSSTHFKIPKDSSSLSFISLKFCHATLPFRANFAGHAMKVKEFHSSVFLETQSLLASFDVSRSFSGRYNNQT